MSPDVVTAPPPAGAGPPSDSAPGGGLPDINAERYPFAVVQGLLDRAVYVSVFSRPEAGGGPLSAPDRPGAVTGVAVREALHRCDFSAGVPSRAAGLRGRNVVGECLGRFEGRWLFAPDNFRALPGREPPATAFDPRRPQRFVMLDGKCAFGDGRDGFCGFGAGSTFPAGRDGPSRVLVGAVGNVMRGFGRLSNLVGTYTYCGTLDPDRGFLGHLLCRFMDPDNVLGGDARRPLEPACPPEEGVTYVLFRGQKRGREQRTAYRFGADGQVNGLLVETDLRQMNIDVAACDGGVRTAWRAGALIGQMSSSIDFNLLNPGAPGTALAPVPFRSRNEYSFADADGNRVGTLTADGGEGRTFNLSLPAAPGQQALRFGAFGRILGGTEQFRGAEGLMTDNSVVGIAPHALATLYVLRLCDPAGAFRTTPGAGDPGAAAGWGPAPPPRRDRTGPA